MSDLSKLTVAKLKCLCKEKGLKNYSKLSKPALLDKLGAAGSARDASNNIKGQGKPKRVSEKDVSNPSQASLIGSSAHSSATNTLPGVGNEVEESLSEPRASTIDTSAKSGTFELTSPFPKIPSEDIDPSSPAQNHSKRSHDNAFPLPALSEQHNAPKKPKNSHKPSPLPNSCQFFKVPDVPRREDATGLSSSANGMSICAPEKPQPRSNPQYATSLLGNLSYSPRISVTTSCSMAPSQNSERTARVSLVESTVLGGGSVLVSSDISNPSRTASALNLRAKTPAAQGTGSQDSIIHSRKEVQNQAALHPFNAATTLLTRPKIGLSSRVVPSSGTSVLSSTTPAIILSDTPSRRLQKKFKTPRLIPNSLTERHIQMPSPPNRRPTHRGQTMEVGVLPLLKDIGIPPSMSQRKHLPVLSLALIYLYDAERASCVFVSRVFRYAVYVSAKDILNRWFAGRRLSRLIHGLSSRGQSLDMINLWPYLRLRQQEVTEQKDLYERGWVPRLFRELGAENTLPVSEELWASPDQEEQLSVALRFIQTRICLALSFHALENAAEWVTSTVTDARQVLENEVWSITVTASSRKNATFDVMETFCVLYQTCEVIGHPPPAQSAASSCQGNSVITFGRSSQIPLRADWSSYIDLRLPTATRHLHPPLSDLIRWTNEDDFKRGVARVWLRRIEGQGEEGELKKRVAERYVLGCVAGNSVSGEYKSTTKMAMEFAGVPEVPETSLQRRHAAPRVSMYLPERHNIESVHFTSPRGPLHPDIALVQTAGRQEATFVLRENGAVIGEDDRVPEVWMKLLRCSEKGMES